MVAGLAAVSMMLMVTHAQPSRTEVAGEEQLPRYLLNPC